MLRLVTPKQKLYRFLSSCCQLLIRPVNKANIPLFRFPSLVDAKLISEVNQRLPG